MKADEPLSIPLDVPFDHYADIPELGTINSGVDRV